MNWTIEKNSFQNSIEKTAFVEKLVIDCGLEVSNVKSDLFFDDDFLTYRANKGLLVIDFIKNLKSIKNSHLGPKKELMAKSLGLSKKSGLRILDGTCGMGQDSLRMLFWGANVIGFERNLVLYCLLKDAYRRALKCPETSKIMVNFSLHFGDVCRINHLIDSFSFDSINVLYFDPMYPAKKKSSLPKKNMQIFSKLVGKDEDRRNVIEWGLDQGKERVVVKSPDNGEVLYPERLIHSFKGKTVRYDLYR